MARLKLKSVWNVDVPFMLDPFRFFRAGKLPVTCSREICLPSFVPGAQSASRCPHVLAGCALHAVTLPLSSAGTLESDQPSD